MKKTLLALFAATIGFGQAQAKTDLQELDKELEIMTNILQTALGQNKQREGIRFRSVSNTYLASQGIVFDINTSNGGWHFNFDFGDMLSGLPMVAPVAPVPPTSGEHGGGNWSIEIDSDEWEEVAREAVELRREVVRETQHKLRELREREREFSWEQREYERRRRDLEFEKRNADQERLKELEQRTKELDKELEELQGKRKEVSQYAQEIEAQQKKQAEEQNAIKKKQYVRFLADFEANVADVLCKYGAGIKALPDNENVSFVLANLTSDANSQRKQDKIYVFSHKDIQSCVRDKINANDLLQKANTYLF